MNLATYLSRSSQSEFPMFSLEAELNIHRECFRQARSRTMDKYRKRGGADLEPLVKVSYSHIYRRRVSKKYKLN